MVPSFLARHPAPANDPRVEPGFGGPPAAPPSRVKPAPEMSKDFFRNMRDLQNSMEDFSRLHDVANEYVTPYTNFSDEGVSSLLFIFLSALTVAAFIASQLVPWRAIALAAGWCATLIGHPEAQKATLSSYNIKQIQQLISTLQTHLNHLIAYDIILNEPSPARQVEIFELQKFQPATEAWEPWLFSPTPYDPLSPTRIAGDRPKGTQFFEDVTPPAGWTWKNKKWEIDLFSREWVEGRCISGVEVETEGGRWVYDLPGDEVQRVASEASAEVGKGKNGSGKRKESREVPRSGWEEGGAGASVGRGEWRRRRWIRVVERRAMGETQ